MRGHIFQDGETKRYFLDGVEVTQEMYDAYFPSLIFPSKSKYTKDDIEAFVRHGKGEDLGPEHKKRLPRGYPIKSDALAVHPSQREEAMEDARKRGVPTEFLRDGRPVLRDAAHRRAYLKAYGYHDRNSFTGY